MSRKQTEASRALRGKLLAEKVPPPRAIELDGETYYVRKPVMSDRDEIMKLALGRQMKSKDKNTPPPTDRMVAATLITLACDEVGAPIFELADFDTLRSAATGSLIERLGVECMAALSPRSDELGKAQGAPKEIDSLSSSQSALEKQSPNSET